MHTRASMLPTPAALRALLQSPHARGEVFAGICNVTRVGCIVWQNALAANALSPRMQVQFWLASAALMRITPVVVIGSVPRATLAKPVFCAGADLQHSMQPHLGEAMCQVMNAATRCLAQGPAVSVAAWHGLAVGGGAELVCAPNVRLASSAAALQFVQRRMGLSPGWGGGLRLAELVGQAQALELLLGCERLDARACQTRRLVTDTLHCNDSGAMQGVPSTVGSQGWSAISSKQLREAIDAWQSEQHNGVDYASSAYVEACEAAWHVPAFDQVPGALQAALAWMEQRWSVHEPAAQQLLPGLKSSLHAECQQAIFQQLWFGAAHRAALDRSRRR